MQMLLVPVCIFQAKLFNIKRFDFFESNVCIEGVMLKKG